MQLLISARNYLVTILQILICSTPKRTLFFSVIIGLLLANSSLGQTVTINSNVVGETPSIIGLNSGNYIPLSLIHI